MIAKAKESSLLIVMIPLMLVLFISSLDQTIVATALPKIADLIGGKNDVSWVTTSYLITSSITTLLLGKLGDLFGRKIILQTSLILFLAGSLLCGAASSMLMLIVFRAFQGIGGGGLNALVMAVIGDLVPARERSRYQGLTGMVPAIALIAGPFLGGFISDHFSWRWIFYINLPIGIAAFLLIALRMQLPRGRKSSKIDWLGAILITVSTTALLLALSWGGQKYGWDSTRVLGLFMVAGIGMVLFLLTEWRSKEPITPLGFFKSSIFNISSLQFMLATLSLFVAMVFVPMYLQYVKSYSGTAAGSFVIPMMVGLMITSSISGILIAKTGRYKYWPVLGSVLIGAGMWLLSGVYVHTSNGLIVAAMLIAGMGQGAIIQVALLAGQNAVPYRYIGAATGALNFFKGLGGAFGSAVFAAILTHGIGARTEPAAIAHAFGHTFAWAVPFMAVSLILGLLMREKPLSEEMEKIASGQEEAPEY